MENEEKKKAQDEKREASKSAMKVFDEMQNTSEMERIIKDNMIEFKCEGKLFRVKKPNGKDQDEVDGERRKKLTELMKDDSYLFRKQWIENYKAKGIDIKAMENELVVLQADTKVKLLKLATITEKNIVEDIKKEIEELRQKQYDLSMKITDYLGYCIESQLRIYTDSYTACVILEVKIEDDKDGKDSHWERYFKTYEQFQESSELELTSKTFYYFQYLMYGD